MYSILTQSQIHEVLRNSYLRNQILSIIHRPGSCWPGGQKAVFVAVVPGSNDLGRTRRTEQYGPETHKYEANGEHFPVLAWKKAGMSRRTQMSTRALLEEYPFLLENGDCLYAGGVYGGGLAVGAAGLTEDADEEVAQIVHDTLMEAAKQEVRRRKKSEDLKDRQLPPPPRTPAQRAAASYHMCGRD